MKNRQNHFFSVYVDPKYIFGAILINIKIFWKLGSLIRVHSNEGFFKIHFYGVKTLQNGYLRRELKIEFNLITKLTLFYSLRPLGRSIE